MSKRKDLIPAEEDETMEIMPLGAGNEVGRSCVYMKYKGKHVMFDCGIHPAYSGIAALPFFDEIDPADIDVLLVTQRPGDGQATSNVEDDLLETSFKGQVYMTQPTKAVYKLLVTDYIRVSKVSDVEQLFTEKEIEATMDKISVIDFHQEKEVNGIKFWCYAAGHVLGAAMFMVDIAGVRVLYTGDYSREEDRHLKAAEMPPFSPELCIIESTYGLQIHQKREERENRFTELVSQTVLGGGRVLIPAFALGRAQELLLILDEYWGTHRELQRIPVYYASQVAKKALAVYETYIYSMNDRIQRLNSEKHNPFHFQYIQDLGRMSDFEDTGPCVVLASPGGLQSGLSRQLFDLWCQDRKNSCIIPGYVVEGTLAKTILNEPQEVTLSSGLVVPLRMRVHYISFSAHADFQQTSAFLEELKPGNIVLVHGEANEMGRLRGKLTTQFAERKTPVFTPKNTTSVKLTLKGQKMAKAVGRIAEKVPAEGEAVSGLLVKKGFQYQLLAPEDLPIYTQLATGSVVQRQGLHFTAPFSALARGLQKMYEGVEFVTDAHLPTLQVHETVTVVQETKEKVVLQWVSDPVSDMVADSIVGIALQLGASNSGPLLELTAGDSSVGEAKELNSRKVMSLLENMFGEVHREGEGENLRVVMDGESVLVDPAMFTVEGEDETLRERVKAALGRLKSALYPLSLAFGS